MKQLFLIPILATGLSFSSCETLQKLTSFNQETVLVAQPTSDQLIVVAEKTTREAKDAIGGFLKVEYDNRSSLMQLNPSIHEYSNYLRLHWQGWLVSARNLTKAYKSNRNSQNEASLRSILATLQSAQTESQKYIALAK